MFKFLVDQTATSAESVFSAQGGEQDSEDEPPVQTLSKEDEEEEREDDGEHRVEDDGEHDAEQGNPVIACWAMEV